MYKFLEKIFICVFVMIKMLRHLIATTINSHTNRKKSQETILSMKASSLY